ASKEEEDEEVVFEGITKIEKRLGEASVSAEKEETKVKTNGTSRNNGQSSFVDSTTDEDEEESDSIEDFAETSQSSDEEEDEAPVKTSPDDFLNNIHFQKRDDPRAQLTHETMCSLRQNIESLGEERDTNQPSTSRDGVVIPDPFHALHAMDHNLWVLASAASLRLNESGERCRLLIARSAKGKTKNNLTEVLPKALAALSGNPIPLKAKLVEPEKEVKGKKGAKTAAAAAAAAKPAIRERPVREKAEPKKKLPPPPKEDLKSAVASPRPVVASPRVATPAAPVEPTRNGKAAKERPKEEETTTPATTRKRKQPKERDEKEEKKEKEIKPAAKVAKAGSNSNKRVSNRVVKKAKEDEPTYCVCHRISFGDMIGCDNEKCTIEWFHFECINIKVKPKGKWYCPDCRVEPNNFKQPK
ncbi:hypothetical protein PFISCL1PPCAC_10051, partial [Pristionchus fissidentatus]